MLSRSKKKSQTVALSDQFSRAKGSFLVSCMGLNAEKMTALRKDLKKNQGNIQIIRNTLSLRVIEEKHKSLKEIYGPRLKGPSAFVLAFEDAVKIAKIIDEFSKENELFKIKGAELEGKSLNENEFKTLAELPSVDFLKAQFLGLLSTPLTKFLSILKEAPQSFVRILAEKQKQTDSRK